MGAGRAARGLLRAAAWATLAAGAVGAARQAAEARARREGRRPPLGPATHDVAAAETDRGDARTGALGRAADRIARWVPAPPRTTGGRVIAVAWAAPLTAIGLALAVASGGRPRWDAERRCLVVTAVRGPSDVALRGVGAAANTIGAVVLVRGRTAETGLLDHEAVHVRQGERLGPLLPVAYAWAGARYGYAANPFERAAREGARRAAELRRARGGC